MKAVLVFLFLVLRLVPLDASSQPRQRVLQVYSLNDTAKLSLCSLTNGNRFRDLLSPLLVPRIVNTEQHKRVALYLKRKLEEYGFTTEWDRFSEMTPYGQKTFRNLIATFDVNSPRRIVFACHYDSKIFKGATFIGATDSAVPCAMLLDLAATLQRSLRRNSEVTLQLIFFDGEEAFVDWTSTDSIYGSKHLAGLWSEKWYAQSQGSSFNIRHEIDRIDVLVLLDLLGVADPQIRNFHHLRATDLFGALPQIEHDLKNRLKCIHQLPQMFYGELSPYQVEDDHIPFYLRKVPVLHIIPTPFPPVWHTLQDDESALDYRTIDNLVSVFRVFAASYLGIVP